MISLPTVFWQRIYRKVDNVGCSAIYTVNMSLDDFFVPPQKGKEENFLWKWWDSPFTWDKVMEFVDSVVSLPFAYSQKN